MKNVTELRNSLAKVFDGLSDGSIQPSVAAEINNSAGKMINTCKIQLEYAAQRKEAPNIPFLDGK
jgi:hypothetical protein